MKVAIRGVYDEIGSTLGYSLMQRQIANAWAAHGHELNADALVHLWMCPPYAVDPKPGAFTVLYTMFEFDPLPVDWEWHLNACDLIIVPCEHNRQLFRRHTETPVEVVPLGVDLNRYAHAQRSKSSPFVWLYVGADNHRKGTVHIARAWQLYNKEYPAEAQDSVLILKMTAKERSKALYSTSVERVYFDYRVLPLDDGFDDRLPTLAALYRYANAFLFPTMGEGFGLTLAEAMATGLPCIYTPWSGPVDFIGSEEGYPVDYRMVSAELLDTHEHSLGKSRCASAEIDSIVEQMHSVYSDYDVALAKGARASERIKPYTWDACAQRLAMVLQRQFPEVAA